MSADNGGKAAEREETLPEEKRNTEDGSGTAPSAGEREETLPEEKRNTEDGSGTAPSAGEREETLPEEKRNTEDGLDTAPPAGEREETLSEEKRNTEDGLDTAPSAGEREETLSEEKRNTEDGSGTAPSAGEKEETLSEEKRNTEDGSGTAPSAGEREETLSEEKRNTEDGSGTAPSAGESYRDTEDGSGTAPPARESYKDTEDGSDTLSSTKCNFTEGSGDQADSGRPAAELDPEPSTSQPGNMRPGDIESGHHGETQKPPEDESPPSSRGQGLRNNDGDKSVGFVYWEKTPDIISLINRLLLDICSGCVMPGSPEYESDWTIVERLSPVIMIFRSQTPASSLRRFLDVCSRTHGPEEMMMVVTDVEDTGPEWAAGLSPPYPLVTLTEAEVDEICTSDSSDISAERRMARKVTRMMGILQAAAENSATFFQRLMDRNKFDIGIFSREAESQYSWLVAALTSHRSRDRAPEVRTCSISNTGVQRFRDDVSQCKFGILYHSKNRGRVNVTDVTDSLYDEELQYLHSRLGRKNVIVVIDDLDDSGDLQKTQIQNNQPSIRERAEDLFLISNEEKKSNYQRRLMGNRGRAEKKLQRIKDLITKRETAVKSWLQFAKRENPERDGNEVSADARTAESAVTGGLQDNGKRVLFKKSVGIFSRSSENEYSWLQNLMESQDFSKIQSVHSCYISNNGFSRFRDVVSQCKFGILYHSKNRGRVNVTDVTDSLYDEELQYLHSRLGKKNVVVVIDDLDDADHTMRDHILGSQPKIKDLAQDLILVRSASPEEKKRRAKDALRKVLH